MSSETNLPLPPPPGLNYIAAIQPSLTYILVMTPLGSMIVPIVILLVFFSTSASRSQPVFYLNVFACLIGVVECILNAALEVKEILHPTEEISQSFFLATIGSVALSPVIVDSILLTRVLAFYPARGYTPMKRIQVLIFPVFVKCGRLVAVILYLHKFTVESKNLGSVLLVGEVIWFRNPYSLTEWTLQMVDNTYSSLFFLYKLRLFNQFGRSGWVNRHPTMLSRIRGLFYIALGNFIFPIIFNVAQIVLVTSDHSFINGSYLLMINNYVSIIGVVFATIWTSGSSWNRSTFGSTGSTWNQESDRLDTAQHFSGRTKQAHTVRLPNTHLLRRAPSPHLLPRVSEGDDGSRLGKNIRIGDGIESVSSLNKADRSLADLTFA
ncbi:hypothetical protein DFH11DRAFT_249005 [Phellopilus nigrolimitatus]|nr:hypothetical protein DFH11DRAFT_249005 [Phellopilus nigrolimitatus]